MSLLGKPIFPVLFPVSSVDTLDPVPRYWYKYLATRRTGKREVYYPAGYGVLSQREMDWPREYGSTSPSSVDRPYVFFPWSVVGTRCAGFVAYAKFVGIGASFDSGCKAMVYSMIIARTMPGDGCGDLLRVPL
jgi:hypothetical protein